MPDHKAIYRQRRAKAIAAGHASLWDQRKNRRLPEVAVLRALQEAGCEGPELAARIAVEALQDEGWLPNRPLHFDGDKHQPGGDPVGP